jgi:hypothetical protein
LMAVRPPTNHAIAIRARGFISLVLGLVICLASRVTNDTDKA